MVTTSPRRLSGTLDVRVHGSGGPSVPPGSITAVTATRGFKDGKPGVWWTFYRKRVCR